MLALTIVALALAAALAPLPATFVERWYSRGLYPWLQPLITRLSSVVPLALMDIAAAALVVWGAIAALRSWRRTSFGSWLKSAAAVLLVAGAVLYLWFLAFWGLNYRRVPLERKLHYDASRVRRERALEIAQHAVDQANRLAIEARLSTADASPLARAFGEVEQVLGASRPATVAAPKPSLVTWYFRKAAVDGMTDPFFLEIIVNPDLLPSERPFTLAHEWAHLAGYADESEANFVAWLACIRADAQARYSGWLAAYQYLARELPRDDRKLLSGKLSPEVVADLAAIRLRVARSHPALTRVARGAYDGYLRANRIEEGIANYGVVSRLMVGTSFDSAWNPELRR